MNAFHQAAGASQGIELTRPDSRPSVGQSGCVRAENPCVNGGV